MEKDEKEAHEERVLSAAYTQVCDDIPGEKQGASKEANERMEILQAGVQKYEADAAQRAVVEHRALWRVPRSVPIMTRVSRHRMATSKRRQEYTESIDALDECIATLKKHAHDVGQAAAALAREEKHEEAVQFARYKQVWDDADMADDEEEDMCWNGEMKAQMKAMKSVRMPGRTKGACLLYTSPSPRDS